MVKKLIVRKMAAIAIPPGSKSGLADGVAFLSSKDKITSAAREATTWVEAALQAVRSAAEPNEWKHRTDEEIAGHILQQIEQRR